MPLLHFGIKAYALGATAIICYVWPSYIGVLGIVHVLLYFLLVGRFITMFHDANHHPLLKNKKANLLFVDVLGMLYGCTPRTYFSFHVVMHHPENNEHKDFSTTLVFQRDSVRDFLKYYLKFFFGIFGLKAYFNRFSIKKVKEYGTHALLGEFFYVCLAIALGLFYPLPTLIVFLFPFFMTRTLLIIGNWGEHAFIDADDYQNLYKSSTNILGKYNYTNFNVGYHIGHHIYPGLHYSELAHEFERNIQRYAQADAMVFRDIHYPHIWLYLMLKKYKKLASYYVHLPGVPQRSTDEIVELMKQRVTPIHDPR